MKDIRLPNPLDLNFFLLFRKVNSLSKTEVLLYKPKEFSYTVNWDYQKDKYVDRVTL